MNRKRKSELIQPTAWDDDFAEFIFFVGMGLMGIVMLLFLIPTRSAVALLIAGAAWLLLRTLWRLAMSAESKK